MRIGIFFGGPSREREISFAGGRTVYDNLNKSLFTPIPIFVDSQLNFILLDWEYIYKGSIRDFYPPVEYVPKSDNAFQVYIESLSELTEEEQESVIQKVGQRIHIQELPKYIDFAFLCLHGYYGEDGQIQGLLESLQIPYSGSGILASALGMDKSIQKRWMSKAGFHSPEIIAVNIEEWKKNEAPQIYVRAKRDISFPLVIRPANQGSSIGVSILRNDDYDAFKKLMDNAFFRLEIKKEEWISKSGSEKIEWVRELTDLRDSIGFPLFMEEILIYHPDELLHQLQIKLEMQKAPKVILQSVWREETVILEAFIEGKEFSCIVVRNEDGSALALPPTEIIKGKEVFDYRSKYLPGMARKSTPIDLADEGIIAIQEECEKLFEFFGFNTYARIDGFIQADGKIILNDPNTTSGMLPSSFFFHQAAEIGLNPSQFISYIIRTSIWERNKQLLGPNPYKFLLDEVDNSLKALLSSSSRRIKIGVILGGYSFERHISVESGRNIFEKLASSDKYEAIPIFLVGNEEEFSLYQIPINLLLKDNADDIRDKILHFKQHPVIENIKQKAENLTQKYCSGDVVFKPQRIEIKDLKSKVNGVFIALHGRPGEDGTLQQELEKLEIPYNGSGIASSQITINKYKTLQTLRSHGFSVTDQLLINKIEFYANPEKTLSEVTNRFGLPLVVKPVDDGCSSAVKLINSKAQLNTYLKVIFREEKNISASTREDLGLKFNEEFPQKTEVLIERLITREEASHFLEITGGMLTHHEKDEMQFEIFEPSEALVGGEILSLEEKFLAGEGQNITPARFAKDKLLNQRISEHVKNTFENVAKVLGVKGYCRIDAFVRIFPDDKVETIIIEVNSLPGMTPATCIFHQTALNGYKPYDFIDKILEFAFDDQKIQQEEI
jgi:D-alanine-D-alanine ligase